MPDPAITVVIPALNAGKVIAETLASVCQQTFPHWEALIAIDDGSTDDSADIVRQFSQRDSRFQLIHQTERGVSAARNQAIARGKGEFIAFLDADDLWLPEKLEKQIKLFESGQRIDVAFTNFHFWDGEKDSEPFFGPHRPMPAGNLDQEIILSISRLCPTMSVQMMRKETLEAAGLFDAKLRKAEDWDLLLRLAESELWVAGVSEPLVRYRQWAGNGTKEKLKDARANVDVLIKNRHLTKRPDLRRQYSRALPIHKCNVELIRARELIDAQTGGVARQILRAWQANPRKIKWLLRSALAAWPNALGGHYFKGKIYRKILQRY